MARPIFNQAGLGAHVRGLSEAKAAFQRLPEVVRARMLAATETTVREIARGAQARLRASPSIQTRALHDHVAWKVTKSNGRGRVGIATGSTVIGGTRVRGLVTAGRGGSALKSAGARIDKPSRRAHFVEFGTAHMPAEPFMLPAADAEKGHHLARCKAAGQEIERDLSIGRSV
jgi:HK97 gp10 family phage protein